MEVISAGPTGVIFDDQRIRWGENDNGGGSWRSGEPRLKSDLGFAYPVAHLLWS